MAALGQRTELSLYVDSGGSAFLSNDPNEQISLVPIRLGVPSRGLVSHTGNLDGTDRENFAQFIRLGSSYQFK